MVSWFFLIAGCLERVTGEDVPLDPRFYEGQQDADGQSTDPNAGGTGDGPYVGYEGETWHLVGEVRGDEPGPVQIDVNEPDADAPGGVRRAGALHLNEPGPFAVDVPKTVRSLALQAFQDPTVNGPDETDPFAEASIDLEEGPPAELVLNLVKGARGQGPGGGGGAPGSPGGDPNGGGAPSGGPSPGPPPNGLSFPAGDKVTLTGTVVVSRDLPVILDFFHADGAGAGGRSYLGKRVVEAGGWSQEFPEDFGSVEVEAYQDLTGDSRTGDDPAARMERPVILGQDDVDGGVLTIP
ncbi:MAG: hypothetical protein Q8P41_32695 [Pseudomonadota bacterium]|nr:hypothetical protein [Pseudomonadota bacterium]